MSVPDPAMLAFLDDLRERVVRGDVRALAAVTIPHDGVREYILMAVGRAEHAEWKAALEELTKETLAEDAPTVTS